MATTNDRPVRTGRCKMSVTINDADYIVRPHSWNGKHKVYTVVRQDSGMVYETGVGKSYFCSCPDQQKNAPEGGCKHIKALRALWLV